MRALEGFSQYCETYRLPPGRQAKREAFAAALRGQALPNRSSEAWKYLSLKPLTQGNFRFPEVRKATSNEIKALQSHLHPDCHHLVLWKGDLLSELSSAVSTGLTVERLADALSDSKSPWLRFDHDWQDERQKLGLQDEFFDEYIDAFQYGGVCIRFEADKGLSKPLQIIIGTDRMQKENFTTSEIWLDVGERSRMDVIVHQVSVGDGEASGLSMARMKMRLRDSSHVRHVRTQTLAKSDLDFFRTQIFLHKNAILHTLSVQNGAALARHNVDVILNGEGASAEVNGLYKVSGQQVCDHHTRIDHVVGGCQSRQLYKGILDDESRAVFDGQVMIRKGAQKASSEQLNQNLLLSSMAEIDSKPQLEIEADDVKATHGSTVGQMVDEELFYLRSRGLREQEAKAMLMHGFIDELIGALNSPVLEKIVQRLVE